MIFREGSNKERGVVYSSYGELDFTLPLFDKFVLDQA